STMSVAVPRIVLADGILLTATHATRLDHGGAFPWLTAMRRMGPVAVPYESRSSIVAALLAHSPPLAEAPDELRIEIVDVSPRPRVRLVTAPRRDRVHAEVSFDYDGALIPLDAPGTLGQSGDTNRPVRRHFEAEREHVATLQGVGCRSEWDFDGRRQVLRLSAVQVPRAVRALLEDGWHVETAEGVYRQPGAVSIDVSAGIDWFDLNGTVDYDGQSAALPALLAALERGESYVPLDDGSLG